MPDAFTHPGKLGDVIAVLPTVAANARGAVDFWTSDYCRVLTRFLQRQPFIRQVHISTRYRVQDFRHGARPREVAVEGAYDRVVHLGFPGFPDGYVPNWIAHLNGLEPPRADFRLRFARVPRDRPYVACHFRSSHLAAELQAAVARLELRVWRPPSGIWTAAQFDAIAERVASAAFFIGDFSCLSQVAALARTPLLVLVAPPRVRAIPWFRPPDHKRAWYVPWSANKRLPDVTPYLMGSGVIG